MDAMLDDDDFEIGEEETAKPVAECNPLEEHVAKQLWDVEWRILKACQAIEDTEETIKAVLKGVYSERTYGEALSWDSDSDLYTIECEPVQKIKKCAKLIAKEILVAKECWKRVTPDKWVIGVCLENTSIEEVRDLRFYVDVEEEHEISWTSIFWSRNSRASWQKTDAIAGKSDAVATVALHLPKFDGNPRCTVLATISFRAAKKFYQTTLPTTCLSAEETVDASCALDFKANVPWDILTLKSIAIEKTVGISITDEPTRAADLIKFLKRMNFSEISDDAYVVEATGTLMHCLVEILPSSEDPALLKIFSRSTAQMSIILQLLRDEFSGIIDKEADGDLDALMALIAEFEMYAQSKSTIEKKFARIQTDLLLP